ncbi:hypothetical protein N9F34_01300 [Alphaproteobacteria bacterium]|nr:hypothetical protein [Alphaproteobacteria bacterium]
MTMAPNSTNAVDDLTRRAEIAATANDMTLCEVLLLQAINASSSATHARLLLADWHLERHRFDDARMLLAHVVRNSNCLGARLEARAMIRLIDRDVRCAQRLFRQAAIASPASTRALNAIRRIIEQSGHKSQTRTLLRRILVLTPTNADGLAALHWTHIQSSDWVNASPIGQKLLMAAPSRPRDQASFGWACFKSGSGQLANKAMRRAIALAPNDGWTQYTAASIFFTTGDFQRAEKASMAALAVGFNPDDTGFLLARILRVQDRLPESEAAAVNATLERPDLQARWEIVQHTMKMYDFTAA